MRLCRSRSCVSRHYVQFSISKQVKSARLSCHSRITAPFLSHTLLKNLVAQSIGTKQSRLVERTVRECGSPLSAKTDDRSFNNGIVYAVGLTES